MRERYAHLSAGVDVKVVILCCNCLTDGLRALLEHSHTQLFIHVRNGIMSACSAISTRGGEIDKGKLTKDANES